MQTTKQVKYAIFVLIILVIATGLYTVLRPPAPKPIPPPQPAPKSEPQKQLEPIPGVPKFDTSKYKTEPTIKVWLADKGYSVSMPLEKYLEGVVAQEMEPGWPPEALSAQAIAARTLTFSAIEAGTIRKLHQADVSTSKEELQAYAPHKVNNNVREAVHRTRGQVLLYAGSLVNSIYSSCCGQISASKEESFPKQIPHPTPYFQPVKDNCFEYAPTNIQTWSVKIPGSEVASAVGYQGNPGDIKILEKGPSGRILFIGAGNKKIYGAEFRQKVGFDKLKSTLISEMTYDGKSFTFKGQGWGNGVGLCQWGTYTFAKEGLKAEQILKHYYTGVEIIKLYE